MCFLKKNLNRWLVCFLTARLTHQKNHKSPGRVTPFPWGQSSSPLLGPCLLSMSMSVFGPTIPALRRELMKTTFSGWNQQLYAGCPSRPYVLMSYPYNVFLRQKPQNHKSTNNHTNIAWMSMLVWLIVLFMVVLWNRADHIYFHAVVCSFFLSFFFLA